MFLRLFSLYLSILILGDAGKALYAATSYEDNTAWLNLLHYKKNTFSNSYSSRIDDPKFFLAKNGKHSPSEEWQALRLALQDPKQRIEIMCTYPARYELFRRLVPSFALPELDCQDLQQWLTRLNVKYVSLIFASSYPNNPGSLFGHSFLKLSSDSSDVASDMLSYGASYAADVGDVNALSYIAAGLTGGFKGTYSLAPFYLKLREYAHLENRDLFEYRLNLSENEVRMLALHLWEMLQHGSSDYYFLDENCSFAMLALLQAAKPDAHLLDHLPTIVSPMETLQKIYLEPHLLESIKFFPSDHQILAKFLDQLDARQKKLFKQLVDARVSPEEVNDAAVLEALILYEQFEKFKNIGHLQNTSDQILEHALLRRAALKKDDAPKSTDIKATYEPHALHGPRFASVAGETRDHTTGMRLGFRPGYHDLLDPAMSDRYLSVVALDSTLSTNANRILGWHSTILDLKSLEPLRMFDPKPSWRLNASCGSDYGEKYGERYCRAFLGAGVATEIAPRLIVSAMPLLEVGSLQSLNKQLYGGLGMALLSYISLGEIVSMEFDVRSLRLRTNSAILTRYEGDIGLSIHASHSLLIFANALIQRTHTTTATDHREITVGSGVFF